VRWLDALQAMGAGFAPLARAFYVTQVQRTPRMYEFFFSAMLAAPVVPGVDREGHGIVVRTSHAGAH
jgi:hypothetical protein